MRRRTRATRARGREARATFEETSALPDDALLSSMAMGDEHAALIFVRRYQRRLYGLALGIVGDARLAEDVAQEAFVRVLSHATIFDPCRGSVATWVLTITRNLAIDALRVRRPVPIAPDDHHFFTLVSAAPEPGEELHDPEPSAWIRQALAELPEPQRRAIVLAAVYGRTAAEIARAESIPLGTAKSRIRMGMAKLRNGMVAGEEEEQL